MVKFVYLIIADISSYVNVGKNMTDTQCFETASIIINKYPNLTNEDLKVVSDDIKSGFYGKLYDCLDGLFICDCIDKHNIMKLEWIESLHMQRKHEGVSMFSVNEKVLSEISKIANSYNPEKAVSDKPKKDPTPLDNKFQLWLKMFDRIHRRYPVKDETGLPTPLPMIIINGKRVDVHGFLSTMEERDSNKSVRVKKSSPYRSRKKR